MEAIQPKQCACHCPNSEKNLTAPSPCKLNQQNQRIFDSFIQQVFTEALKAPTLCKAFWINMLSCSVVSNSLQPHGIAHQDSVTGFPRQEYWSGSYFLFQKTFLTQGSNPSPLYCRQILLSSEPPGKPCLSWIDTNVNKINQVPAALGLLF